MPSTVIWLKFSANLMMTPDTPISTKRLNVSHDVYRYTPASNKPQYLLQLSNGGGPDHQIRRSPDAEGRMVAHGLIDSKAQPWDSFL